VLRLLVDTSVWLDLAKRRDGQRWIVPIRVLMHQGELELLVPSVVIAEFEGTGLARKLPSPQACSTAFGRFARTFTSSAAMSEWSG
jgi:hypothetical protein